LEFNPWGRFEVFAALCIYFSCIKGLEGLENDLGVYAPQKFVE